VGRVGKIRTGDLLAVSRDARTIKFPGEPIFDEEIGSVHQGDVIIALGDEFIHTTRMGNGHRIDSLYVRVLTPSGCDTFMDPASLIPVSHPHAADKIVPEELQ